MKNALLSLLLLLLLLAPAVHATEEGFAQVSREEAGLAINESRASIYEMSVNNLSTNRVSDIFVVAQNLLDANYALEKQNESYNYFSVILKTRELAEVKREAFEVSDSLRALEINLIDAENSEGANFSEARELFASAKKEFRAERFEKANDAIDSTYAKIEEIEQSHTKLRAIYEASTRTIAGFFQRNWQIIIIFVTTLSILAMIFWKKIMIIRISRKIIRLELEKKTIDSLIMEAQKNYFVNGVLSEDTYKVKTQKYREMKRDINRQIPIFKTRLKRLS